MSEDTDYIYILAKLMRKGIKLCPSKVIFSFLRIMGCLLFYLNRKKREVGFKNIKLAFPHTPYQEVYSILKSSFVNFMMSLGEVLVETNRRVIFSDSDFFSQEAGIIVGIHEGNWEVCNFFLARKFNYAILVKRQKSKGLDRLLNEIRRENSLKVCFSLKEIVGWLKKNYWVGMVIDQGAEKNAPYVEFLGQTVPTPSGSIYLAKKFGKKIYPLFTYRENDNNILKNYGGINPAGKATNEILREINCIYEKALRQYPQEYMWWFKRFKKRNNLKILILNDGRTGHLKQSQALGKLLQEVANKKVESKEVEVRYKNKIKRLFSEIFALFSGKRCLGCGRCLRLCLEEESYYKLEREFADIVISTGSKLAPVNRVLSFCLGAKSIVILKPNLPLNKFDLVVVPYHDKVKQGKNIVKIKGALSFCSDKEKMIKECRIFFNLSEKKKVAFLIGGVMGDGEEFLKNIEVFIEKLKKFVEEKGYKLLVTTSSRTPTKVENLVEKKFRNFIHTEALIIANRQNYPFVIPGFLGMSDIIFISSDSVSMISESLAAGKVTVCVFLEKVRKKHHRLFLNSWQKGMVNFLVYPYNFFEFSSPVEDILCFNKSAVKEVLRKFC